MSVYKVYVAGLVGSGKTSMIKAVSDLPLVSVLKKIALTQHAIPLDYGRVYIEPDMCYFYAAASGTLRSDDWIGLSHEMTGMIYIVDGATDHPQNALALLLDLMRCWQGPVVVGVNGVDRSRYSNATFRAFEQAFGMTCPIFPFTAQNRNSSLLLVQTMIVAMGSGRSDGSG